MSAFVWSCVSIPSAITATPSVRASSMIMRTNDASRPPRARPSTNDFAIFSMSNGSVCR